jgi:GT2 family glycosyltransferase
MAIDIRISVVIVTWNSREHIAACLDALRRQDFPAFEVIVVDNDSTDMTGDIIKKKYPEVIFLPQKENRGFSFACNRGIEAAKGHYIFFLNPDAYLHEGVLKGLCVWMDHHPEIVLCAPRILNENGSLQGNTRALPTLWSEFCQEFRLSALFPKSKFFASYYLSHWPHDREREVSALTGAAFFTRREIFDEIGLFDDKMFFLYYEELDLCARLKTSGKRIMFLPQFEITHVGGGSSKQVSRRCRRDLLNSRFNYHRKYRSCFALVFLFLLHLASALLFSFVFKTLFICGWKTTTTGRLAESYRDNFSFLRYYLRVSLEPK